MHELTVTSLIVDAVLDLVRKQGASHVLEVVLRVGQLRALSLDQVRFCYGVISKGTVLEGSKLTIEESPGKVHCANCGHQSEFNAEGDAYHFGLPPLICPMCSGSLMIEGGDECVISKVRMQLPSTADESTPAP